ncbi:Inosose dehydratase [Aquisphaera giovannonii]|uniref:Inosose dehydratase n=1 Tax=Aquisphaera giovannonii TaxID=406548 RepID=A0A5B9W3H9_9BACT|nr:sugar phosphate isomerase/epimerase [Aquisphaera giovannonii]QEH34625.1 Inosose dehydratase [Aquisphaera giovannonii]
MTRDFNDHRTTRRTFLGGAAALAGVAALPRRGLGVEDARPNSVFGGVRVGCITYSYRGEAESAQDTLKALIDDGLSETELMGGPIQSFAGLGRGHSDADRQAQLARCAELRKMFNDAGVNIHIHKLAFGRDDADIDFHFEVAKVLGCKAITTERNEPMVKRLAPFAEKHKVWVAFHNHTDNTPTIEDIDPLMQVGDYVGFNFDIGHYVAGTKGKSPVPVIEKYHEKIVSLHLKDRTVAGGNVPWGQGQTPIKEVLQLLKKEKWPIYADIEVEYPIPEGSSAVKEVAKCVAYCKEALA